MYIYVKLQVVEVVVVVKVIVVVVDEVTVVQDLGGQFYVNHSTPLDGLCS